MKLVTWNVNSLTTRLPRVLEFLAQHQPDVLCLQETKVTATAFPLEALAAAGYRGVHQSAGQWAGVAILLRDTVEIEEPVFELEGVAAPAEARWIEASVRGLRVCTVYVPNGRVVGSPHFAAKLRFVDAMIARARALAGRGPVAILGDFNVAPSDLDVYDPMAFIGSTHVTAEERRGIARLLEIGLIDAFRHLHPTEVGYTWWDYRAGHFHRKMGLRIDLVLLSRALAPRLLACGIDRNYRKGVKPSDHAPLIAELRG